MHTNSVLMLMLMLCLLPTLPMCAVCSCQARFGLVGLQDDAFPRVKLFKRGQDTAKPIDYTGSLKSETDMLSWTVGQTGVFVGIKASSELVAVAMLVLAPVLVPWQLCQ